MAIPESQLETWSHQGSITQSSTTYGTVKRALEADDTKYANQAFKVFLQGSYGNDTNIYAESDVDIVIRLDSTYHFDIGALS
jgi:tRNA nucleotidyltransferase (CCA-adding enzyme)